MAFGTISAEALKVQPTAKDEPKIITPMPASIEKGASEIDIAIVASGMTQAEDFVCGVYFNMVEASAGTSVSVYTHEFKTVTRLAEIKSELETASRKPTGTEIKRVREEYAADLSHCSITLGQSGSKSLTLDVNFSVTAPNTAGSADADAVFALLDLCCPDIEDIKTAALRTAGGTPVYWIVTGFEEAALLWSGDYGNAPKPHIKDSLRGRAGVPCRAGDHVAYVQMYGGIRFVRSDDSGATFLSHGVSRDYAPCGCHMPVLTAVEETLRHRANDAESADTAANTIRSSLNTGFAKLNLMRDNWCEYYPGNEGDETK